MPAAGFKDVSAKEKDHKRFMAALEREKQKAGRRVNKWELFRKMLEFYIRYETDSGASDQNQEHKGKSPPEKVKQKPFLFQYESQSGTNHE